VPQLSGGPREAWDLSPTRKNCVVTILLGSPNRWLRRILVFVRAASRRTHSAIEVNDPPSTATRPVRSDWDIAAQLVSALDSRSRRGHCQAGLDVAYTAGMAMARTSLRAEETNVLDSQTALHRGSLTVEPLSLEAGCTNTDMSFQLLDVQFHPPSVEDDDRMAILNWIGWPSATGKLTRFHRVRKRPSRPPRLPPSRRY